MKTIPLYLKGGGDCGKLIREHNWENTTVGHLSTWPETLRSAVSICINSGFPIAVYWGEDFSIIYNDAYSPILGTKHPWALGRPGEVAWSEIWDGLRDQFAVVKDKGDSLRYPDTLLLMNRFGYTEECYFDYSLSPIISPDGTIGGVFNAVIETTYRVINSRRTAVLQHFQLLQYRALVVYSALKDIKEVLDGAKADIPFYEIYPQGDGITKQDHKWPFDTHNAILIENPGQYMASAPLSAAGDPCTQAFVVPLNKGEAAISGHIILGLSPLKKMDDAYSEFLLTVANYASIILNNAFAREQDAALQKELALNEELAATNEELIAINDELQETRGILQELNNDLEERVAKRTEALQKSEMELVVINEEMAATNEELASTNEELAAINEEMAATNEELKETQADLVKVIAELADSEQNFRFRLNTIPQQVWSAKPDGSLDYVNMVVSDDFGYEGSEIVGQGWQNFIHPEDLPIALEKWIASLNSGEEYIVEFRLRFADGIYRWHLARARPLIENGEITLWLGTNTNIEIQKQNEQKRDEFLSIASHELRTPLTSIKAFNQIMQRMADPEKIKGFMVKSADHITRLEKLISDLLDVTKINAGKMNYNMQSFHFKELLQATVESVQHTTQTHKIILESAVDIVYEGDQFRLEQVLNNFLSNAVKYSPNADKVIVNSHLEQDSLITSVQDFGIGIEQQSLDKLFDRYYRVDNTAMRFEGLGLGLFISSEILKRHGGSFWIESTPGEGSIFYFRLTISQHNQDSAFKNSAQFYKDRHITIAFNKKKQRLDVNWTGFQDFDSVQKGCIKMLEIIKTNKVNRILNDNRQVLGTWSEASDWVGTEFFPMIEEDGVVYLAWIFSGSVFSQLSAKKSMDVAVGEITTQFFTDINLAEQWLDEKRE
ncbi:ATP-binding protein [Mucilaginibacter sp.]|uniref:ATP-binding protein n=1 Tax=Mucilaginibacter sp. TaxID=1882438 RepID=UPI0035BC35F7